MDRRASNRVVALGRAGRRRADRVGPLMHCMFVTLIGLIATPSARAAAEAAGFADAAMKHESPAAPSVGTPVCPFEDAAHCQGMESGNGYESIDRARGRRIADDFRPATDTISRVCWFPCFLGGDQYFGPWFECSGNTGGTPPPDDFVAVFYEDEMGLPGLPVAGQPPGGYSLIPDDKLPADGGMGNNRCWRYTAPFDPPLSVTPGNCYWMEITGVGEDQAEGYCEVYHANSLDGNGWSYSDNDGAYSLNDLFMIDLSWCLDGGIAGATNPPISLDGGCGDSMPTACCVAGPTGPICNDGTYRDCVGTPSAPTWPQPVPFLYSSCGEVGECPRPANDNCADAFPVCTDMVADPDVGHCAGNPWWVPWREACSISQQDCYFAPGGDFCVPYADGQDSFRCWVETDNRLATTDGPVNPAPNCPGASFQADVWYTFTPPCTGTLVLFFCSPPFENWFDAYLQVFSTQSPFDTCPCPASTTSSLGCADILCGHIDYGFETRVAYQSCVLIRLGGYSPSGTLPGANQQKSAFDLGMFCDPLSGVVAVAGSLNYAKNRYLTFTPNNPASDVALRVRKTTPPTGDCWVTAPDANGLARCGSSPFYRQWPESVIHVGDCAIVPDATYELAATLEGVVFSDPLIVSTVPRPEPKFWGDTVGAFESGAWTAPNGVVNTNDFLAALQKFQNLPTAPHVTVTDVQSVSSTDPCLNRVTNIADVFILIQAFQGNAYPFTTDPASCPPCP